MIRVVLIVIALGLAASAGWMVKIYLTGQRARLTEMAANLKPQQLPTTDVLVADSSLDITAMVTKGAMRWQPWPEDNVNSNYITRKDRPDAIDKLAGSAARQPLVAGEPIIEGKLILKKDGGFLAAVLEEGGRAITLKVDEASGIA
ncbi:MAG: Flp pilus assembly protein CpaB, partial [Rhodospirillaceae bacterium]